HTRSKRDWSSDVCSSDLRANGAEKIVLWGYSSGAALATLHADESIDALVLTYPDFAALDGLPEEIRGDTVLPDSRSWPKTYLQIATHDEVVDEIGRASCRERV